MATRWGICCAGKISNDFMTAMKMLPLTEHKPIAVAARSLERAKEFAKLFDIPKAYGSYQELANDPDVEIVYIGSVITEHFHLSHMMLSADKHVLCETPFMLTVKQTKDIIALAKEKKKFLMQGLWTRFFPVYDKIRNELAAETIGDVVYVQVLVSADFTMMTHVNKKELGGGSLSEIGVYALQFVTMVYKDTPQKIIATGHLTKEGVDSCVSLTLKYSDGRMAHIMTKVDGADGCDESSGIILGTKGKLSVLGPFWAPDILNVSNEKYEFPIPKVTIKNNYVNPGGFVYEIQKNRECLLKGKLECDEVSLDETLQWTSILEEARHQVGVIFNEYNE